MNKQGHPLKCLSRDSVVLVVLPVLPLKALPHGLVPHSPLLHPHACLVLPEPVVGLYHAPHNHSGHLDVAVKQLAGPADIPPRPHAVPNNIYTLNWIVKPRYIGEKA